MDEKRLIPREPQTRDIFLNDLTGKNAVYTLIDKYPFGAENLGGKQSVAEADLVNKIKRAHASAARFESTSYPAMLSSCTAGATMLTLQASRVSIMD